MKKIGISLMALLIVFAAGAALAQSEAPTAVATVTTPAAPSSAPAVATPPAPVVKPNPWHLALRGVYGSDDEVTLPQIAATPYHRTHAAMNRSAREFPTLDYYRPIPNTPACPLYTRAGQDEVTLPQFRGDCIR